jgi:hypothetical protein
VGELFERAFDGDDNLAEDTKRFIKWHMNLSEKAASRAVGAAPAGRQTAPVSGQQQRPQARVTADERVARSAPAVALSP